MAVSFDAVSTGTTATTSHTTSGSERLLLVCVGYTGNLGTSGASAVTYGGVSMTQVGNGAEDGNNEIGNQMWYLLAPNTGANNIVLTGASSNYRVTGISFNGVNQSTPLGADNEDSQTNMNSSTPFDINITTQNYGSWIVASVNAQGSSGTSDLSFTSSATIERNEGSAGTGVAAVATQTTWDAGDQVMTWYRNQGTSRDGCGMIVEVVPTTPPVPEPRFQVFNFTQAIRKAGSW